MPQMTFEYDEKTYALISELKGFFQVKTTSGVIRRALAVSKAAKKFSNHDGCVKFINPSDESQQEVFSLNS